MMYRTIIMLVLHHKCFTIKKYHIVFGNAIFGNAIFGNAIFGTYPFLVGRGKHLQRLKFTDLSF